MRARSNSHPGSLTQAQAVTTAASMGLGAQAAGPAPAHLVFPHQLFAVTARLPGKPHIFVAEPALFFTQYRFHPQKLVLHRASLRSFGARLEEKGWRVSHCPLDEFPTLSQVLGSVRRAGHINASVYEVTDDWLMRDLEAAATDQGVALTVLPSPAFLTTLAQGKSMLPATGRFHMGHFYEKQRRRLQVLVTEAGEPEGGRWSFDTENRRGMANGLPLAPAVVHKPNQHVREAISWVQDHFTHHWGQLEDFNYPVTHAAARAQLKFFLHHRFREFGPWEDALSYSEAQLFHSVLSAPLNCGLLTPEEVLTAALDYARENSVPINSLEGFVRQLIGWREFVRLTYELRGRRQRTRNALGHTRRIPQAFWEGNTGIVPLDTVIRRLHASAYCHHIERLMVTGNLMLLCEFHPDDVYQWFMERFIDAYDWVMVPNVYGMTLFADGGLMTTKPYVSSSNYVLKMSDYSRGPWTSVWDGLYWRFVDKHRALFAGNSRVNFAVHTWEKMDEARRKSHLQAANQFLEGGCRV